MKLAYAYFEKYFYIRYMPINANASRFRYGSSFYRLLAIGSREIIPRTETKMAGEVSTILDALPKLNLIYYQILSIL